MSLFHFSVFAYTGIWAIFSTYFFASIEREPIYEKSAFLGRGVTLAFLVMVSVGIGSLWPVMLLGQVSTKIWHLLGHPGSRKLQERYAALVQRKMKPGNQCNHLGHMDERHFSWCVRCGALRKGSGPWIMPTDRAGITEEHDQ